MPKSAPTGAKADSITSTPNQKCKKSVITSFVTTVDCRLNNVKSRLKKVITKHIINDKSVFFSFFLSDTTESKAHCTLLSAKVLKCRR